jgi:hypothetical protein
MARRKLGEILLAAGVIDDNKLNIALAEQRRWGGHLGRILVDLKMITEEFLVQALSQQLHIPAVDLDRQPIDEQVLDLIPGELAEQNSLVPFQRSGKFLDVAMADPTNLGIVDELRIRTQLNVRPYLAGPRMIERAVARYYGRGRAAMTLAMRAANLDLSTSEAVAEVATPRRRGGPTPDPMSAGQRRAHAIALSDPAETTATNAKIINLQQRLAELEALVRRDEDVLRKLMSLLIEKGVATREEILARIK